MSVVNLGYILFTLILLAMIKCVASRMLVNFIKELILLILLAMNVAVFAANNVSVG